MLNAFGQLPSGLILISHARQKEVDSRTGKYQKMTPALSEKISTEVVLPIADIVAFAEIDVEYDEQGSPIRDQRVLRTRPSKFFDAKDRSGRLPSEVDLNYAAFKTAYEQKPTTTKQKEVLS
jgi:hypothetical protein